MSSLSETKWTTAKANLRQQNFNFSSGLFVFLWSFQSNIMSQFFFTSLICPRKNLFGLSLLRKYSASHSRQFPTLESINRMTA